jgi:hypothetical protein
MKQSLDYIIGQLVGEIIYYKYLPTLEIDMLKTTNVINITNPKELEENNQLNDNMTDIMRDVYNEYRDKLYSQAHSKWLEHTRMLAEKYLPEKLECRITQFEITNEEEFKKGLKHYLWDTDLSWYIPQDDFLKPNIEGAWCTTVVLTRSI